MANNVFFSFHKNAFNSLPSVLLDRGMQFSTHFSYIFASESMHDVLKA